MITDMVSCNLKSTYELYTAYNFFILYRTLEKENKQNELKFSTSCLSIFFYSHANLVSKLLKQIAKA